MIRAIAAIDSRRGIARAGKIPWNIPTDSRYWRQKVRGSTAVMGYPTAKSMGEPLPDTRNIIISRHNDTLPGFTTVSSLGEVTGDAWVTGGASIFELALDYCDELYLTMVEGDFDCDRFFPAFAEKFEQVEAGEPQQENGYTFRFTVWHRKAATS